MTIRYPVYSFEYYDIFVLESEADVRGNLEVEGIDDDDILLDSDGRRVNSRPPQKGRSCWWIQERSPTPKDFATGFSASFRGWGQELDDETPLEDLKSAALAWWHRRQPARRGLADSSRFSWVDSDGKKT